jgi:glycosyltransferase involved in cell wall biosynthesis
VNEIPRVAFFPDSYLEVNGAAMTCRRLVEYARRNEHPYLCVHAGPEPGLTVNGSVSHLQLKRSPFSFKLDEELAYDPLFQRHTNKVLRQLVEFKPDVIHITGLNDVSIVGSYLAWKLDIPILGSWHTNIHEFAASRIVRTLRFLPSGFVNSLASFAERKIMQGSILYYKMPKVILSPNQELVNELGRRTKRVSRMMGRGVDTDVFSPAKRTVDDGVIRLGFVGRLRAEKNVRSLIEIEKALIESGRTNIKMLIVGEGNEREFLEQNLKNAEFTGFISGDALAEAYANIDIFLFPSETDAFGNVTQEAHASGVPAIVSDKGGPKFIVREGETGFVAKTLEDYVTYASMLYDNPDKLAEMKRLSRESAMSNSWDSIFEGVYDGYREAISLHKGSAKPEANA